MRTVSGKLPSIQQILIAIGGVSDPYSFDRVRIRIQHFRLNTDPDPIRIQGFDDQKLKKIYSWKKNWSQTTIYLSLGLHKVTEEAFSSQMRTSSTSKHEIPNFFSTFVRHLCHPGSGSGFRIRIRIHWLDWIRIQYGSGSETLAIGVSLPDRTRLQSQKN